MFDAELEPLLSRLAADEAATLANVSTSRLLDQIEALDSGNLIAERLIEATQTLFLAEQITLNCWGEKLAVQAIALGLDPKALRLTIPSAVEP